MGDKTSVTLAAATALPTTEYNAFTEYIKNKSTDTTGMINILKWQRDVSGNTNNIQRFKDTALTNIFFIPFLIMTPGDPNVRVINRHTKNSSPLSPAALPRFHTGVDPHLLCGG
jgi:hypothetical protein